MSTHIKTHFEGPEEKNVETKLLEHQILAIETKFHEVLPKLWKLWHFEDFGKLGQNRAFGANWQFSHIFSDF